MAGRVKLVLQAAAVSVVALLLALLGWQVVRTDEARGLAARAADGQLPRAPGFTLPRLDAEGELSLVSLRGKAVVLNFWASWCLPCRDEAPVLQTAWERYRDRGVVVLGIDGQDFRSDAERFMERFGVTYPIVHDGKGSTWGRYGLGGVPETWFVNRKGRLVGERIQGPVTEEQLDEGIELALGAGT
jgi:cytochrome c biogenesis protein CcmG, thiol:disulfide interchange protein DsbE